MVTRTQQDALIESVRAAARAEIMPRFRALDPTDIETKTGPDDLVTIADRAAERAIAADAAVILPDALIVGEEAVHEDPVLLDRLVTAPAAVIIDPVDGTANFVAGLAVFGVIVAMVEGGETQFGLLYDPVFDDWVMAHKGTGAWYCRPGAAPRRLSGRPARAPDMAQGYLPLHLLPRDERARVGAGLARFGRVTSLRCSCHEYRMLALGHADFAVSVSVKPWDHAAGCLIVEEAGGKVESGGRPGYRAGRSRAPLLALASRESTLRAKDFLG